MNTRLRVFALILFFATLTFANIQVIDGTAPTVDGVIDGAEWGVPVFAVEATVLTRVKSSGCTVGPCYIFVAYEVPYSIFNEGSTWASFMLDDSYNKGSRPQTDDIKCYYQDFGGWSFASYKGNGVTWQGTAHDCLAHGKKDGNKLKIEMQIFSATGVKQFRGGMFEISDGATTVKLPVGANDWSPNGWETLEWTIAAEPQWEASAYVAPASPMSHDWNTAQKNKINEMMVFAVKSTDIYGVDLSTVNIRSEGTGDDSKLGAVKLYWDNDDIGKVSSGDLLLDTKKIGDDSTLTFSFNSQKVPANQVKYYLIVYEMGNHSAGNTFKIKVTDISASRDDTHAPILLLQQGAVGSIPLVSGTKTIVTGAVCSGTLSMSLSPSSGAPGVQATAIATGLSKECAGKNAYLKLYSCDFSSINACTLSANGQCSTPFGAPLYNGIYSYYLCVDKDGDGKFTSAGESSSALLTLASTAVKDYCFYPNCGGCIIEKDCIEHTGCEWKTNYCSLETETRVVRTAVDNGGTQGAQQNEQGSDNTLLIVLLTVIATALVIIAITQFTKK